MTDPTALAFADQLSAEVMDRAVDMVQTRIVAEGVTPLNEAEKDAVQMGVAAGFAVTLLALSERGWIRKPS